MTRTEFHRFFACPGPVVTPVIHVTDTDQVLRNLDTLAALGAAGAFLINHDFGREPFLPILTQVRKARPALWLGVNFLAEDGRVGFAELGRLADRGLEFQALWADDACLDERVSHQALAEEIAAVRQGAGWQGMYFGGVAFKKQRPVEDVAAAAALGPQWLDVVTTSGVATGHAPDLGKIATFRAQIGEAPLALASGVTPQNAAAFADVDCLMVATGINHPGDFYNIDPARLAALLAVTQGEPHV